MTKTGNKTANINTNKKAMLSQRWLCDVRYISGSNKPLQRYCHVRLPISH